MCRVADLQIYNTPEVVGGILKINICCTQVSPALNIQGTWLALLLRDSLGVDNQCIHTPTQGEIIGVADGCSANIMQNNLTTKVVARLGKINLVCAKCQASSSLAGLRLGNLASLKFCTVRNFKLVHIDLTSNQGAIGNAEFSGGQRTNN